MAVYSDLSYDFDIGVDGNVKTVENIESINQGLRTLFFTPTGRRVMDAEFGMLLNNYLFEQLTIENALEIGRLAKAAIIKYEPRIEIININVTVDHDQNAYIVNLTYRVPTYQFTEQVFEFNNVLMVR